MSESKPYRPSNGTEGDIFMGKHCAHCHYREVTHPGAMPDSGCHILGAVMALDIDDPEYPKEWISDLDGSNPRCTYFRKIGTGTHEQAARDKAKYDEAMAAMKAGS